MENEAYSSAAAARTRRQRRAGWFAAVCVLVCAAVGALLPGGPQTAAAGGQAAGVGAAFAGAGPWTIALDAGHGGDEVGARGLMDEVQLTEGTVRELEKLFAEDERFETVLTREYGRAAGIGSRIEQARQAGAALLFSVHGNSEASGGVRGFECFAPPPGRSYNAEGLALGRLVADEMAAAGSPLRGSDGVRYLYFEDDGKGGYERVIRESDTLASYSAGSYALLDGAVCPTLLVEQCFITNAEDVGAFGTPEGCARAAACYYRAICAWFGVQPLDRQG